MNCTALVHPARVRVKGSTPSCVTTVCNVVGYVEVALSTSMLSTAEVLVRSLCKNVSARASVPPCLL